MTSQVAHIIVNSHLNLNAFTVDNVNGRDDILKH